MNILSNFYHPPKSLLKSFNKVKKHKSRKKRKQIYNILLKDEMQKPNKHK